MVGSGTSRSQYLVNGYRSLKTKRGRQGRIFLPTVYFLRGLPARGRFGRVCSVRARDAK